MSEDEPAEEAEEVEVTTGPVAEEPAGPTTARERIEEEADRAVETFDEGVIDLLSWILDTNTRARMFVYLRKQPWSTSEEVAEGTGLYPSTVREALAELHEEGTVERRKRETEGAGNNPYEYTAIPPSELVAGVVQQIQDELNTVFNLDRYLGGSDEAGPEAEPVSINVEEAEDATGGPRDSDEGAADDEADEADEGAADDEADEAAEGAADDEAAEADEGAADDEAAGDDEAPEAGEEAADDE